VTADLDTLLIALYVLIDDHVTSPTRRRPGHPKRLADRRAGLSGSGPGPARRPFRSTTGCGWAGSGIFP
jgi:hypothetical protein